MPGPAFFVVAFHAASAAVLGWVYFRHYQITRPPIGVLNLWDVAMMLAAIVLVPYLYLVLPSWLVVGLLALGMLGILYFTWEPVLRVRWAIWLAAVVFVGLDIGAAIGFGAASSLFFLVNNVVLTVVVVGVTNLWVQSGMKARDMAILAAGLAIYDFIATSRLPLMDDLIGRLAGLPLAPVVAWPADNAGQWLGIGLGDLLLATAFPLVMRKAFGRPAGIVTMVISLSIVGVLLALLDLGLVRVTIPVMVVLGPLMIVQYLFWIRRRRQEQTTWQYLEAEPQHAGKAVQV